MVLLGAVLGLRFTVRPGVGFHDITVTSDALYHTHKYPNDAVMPKVKLVAFPNWLRHANQMQI